jgi:hypothetical protein
VSFVARPNKLKFEPTKTDRNRRRIMPIEQALNWAYAEELARVPPSTEPEFHATHPMWNLRVDGSLGSYDETALRRLAHPDAIEIAKAVDKLNPAEIEHEKFDLGTDQPQLEHTAIQKALPRVHDLIIIHARLSTLPDLPMERRAYPVRSANGEVIVQRQTTFTQRTIAGGQISYQDHELVHDTDRMTYRRAKPTRGRYPQGAVCPLIWAPEWPYVARERAEYMVWRLALRCLSRTLQNLERVAILHSRLALRPWR